VLLISPDGRDNSASIQQDAEIFRILLEPRQSIEHEVRPGRGLWIQMAEGSAELNGITLETGDAAAIEASGTVTLSANAKCNALLFDLH
jgi:redox-sensitive bicupin YhaK (pirin superfamily)